MDDQKQREKEQLLADQKVFIDELNQIRLVNPALLESSSKLVKEGKSFFGQFDQFMQTVEEVKTAMEKIGRLTDRERMRVLSLQNQLETQQQRGAQMLAADGQQMQILLNERQKELERLRVELASVKAVEAQQNEYLAMCKKI